MEHWKKWHERKQCEICGGYFGRTSEYNHFKSKQHQLAEKDNDQSPVELSD